MKRTIGGSAYNLSYDAENRLSGVSGAATATFVYDGDGKRVKETNAYKNLAKGIVVTGSTTIINPDVVANGDTQADSGTGASREFGYSSVTGLQYVQIDLGATFPVNKVVVWHYNGDGRTYHNTKTQVSADGSTWVTVFDSATQGEYAETLAGKTHTFTQQNVRYVRDYLNGSTVNTGNHWTEIEVWGTTSTAYVGDYFEWNGSLQTMTKYYYASGQRVAVRNSNGTGTNGLVYLLGDHLGSASLTADPLDGDKLSELRYKAWGETRYALTSLPTDRRYTGQVEEATIGLYFFNARWYDSTLGRWAQPDVIVPEAVQGVQAWDRYAYVNNSPVNYNDPSGHCLILCTAVIGGAIGGIVGAMGYTAYTVATGNKFNTGHMLMAAGGGAAAGALIGTGVGIAAGMSSAAATTAAITGSGAATTATTTVLNATGGDPSDEISAATNAVQGVGATAGQIAQGANQFWTSTTNFQGNLVYQRPDLINPNMTQGGLTNL